MIDNEGIRAEDTRSCLLCGNEGILLYHGLRDRLFCAPGSWSLLQCPACKLAWLNPRPIPEDIGKLYFQYFTHDLPRDPKGAFAYLRKSIKASILQSSFGYQIHGSNRILGSVLSKIAPLNDIAGGDVRYLKASEKGRLLDVGCGNGAFLSNMKQLGWSVEGIEPDIEALMVARKNLRLNLFQGYLEEAKYPDKYFDAITMNHVIEHVADPINYLKECLRVLKPGGKLVVITPNINSLGRNILNDAWLAWDPPRHLFLFSIQSLRTSAELAGLTIKELRTTAKGARWIWVSSSLIKRNGILKGISPEVPETSLRLQGLVFQLAECMHQNDSGEELVLIATRDE